MGVVVVGGAGEGALAHIMQIFQLGNKQKKICKFGDAFYLCARPRWFVTYARKGKWAGLRG